MCFWHVSETSKFDSEVIKTYFGPGITLKEALENEVKKGQSLSGSFLKGIEVQGSWFKEGPNLPGADFRSANLQEAWLSYGSLNSADLRAANLESAGLGDVDIRNANFTRARLFNTKFRNNIFDGVLGLTKECFRGWKWGFIPIYRMLEIYPEQCEGVYRSLIRYFSSIGLLNDASWAAYRERVTHQRILLKNVSFIRILTGVVFDESSKNQANLRVVLLAFLRWIHGLFELILSFVFRFTFGYGEKPLRVLCFAALIIIGYAMVYNQLHLLNEPGLKNAIYFSIVTFTTLGYGDILPKPEFRLFAATEALVGIVIVGLFLFVLSRRAVGRG
jgi:uncharacterized protein YjbI with pentapeptide repeats